MRRLSALVFVLGFIGLGSAAAATEQASKRHHDILIIQHALTSGANGADVSPTELERRLSQMSDQELRHLAQSAEAREHIGSPLKVVLAGIMLLVLAVAIIVRVVE
jgi:CHASE3 domain sensor protein